MNKTSQNDFFQHAALEWSEFLTDVAETKLVNNEFIKKHPDCLEMAEEASQILANLYQLIGSKDII